jgi:hypothetical protein
VLDRKGRPLAVAKLRAKKGHASEQIVCEAKLMAQLGPSLLASGALAPVSRIVSLPDGRLASVENAVEGTPADGLLARRHLKFRAFLEAVLAVLERWNAATRVTQNADRAWLEREILEPAAAAAPLWQGGEAYLEWLRERCAEVEGKPLPLVATHGDLTTSNILVSSAGDLGLVDWEAATESGLPLGDLLYCLVDAARIVGRYRDRAEAFRSCFEPSGRYWNDVHEAEMRLRQVLQISRSYAILCLHGSWLQHARNEQIQAGAAGPWPFLRIVEHLARTRDRTVLGESATMVTDRETR